MTIRKIYSKKVALTNQLKQIQGEQMRKTQEKAPDIHYDPALSKDSPEDTAKTLERVKNLNNTAAGIKAKELRDRSPEDFRTKNLISPSVWNDYVDSIGRPDKHVTNYIDIGRAMDSINDYSVQDAAKKAHEEAEELKTQGKKPAVGLTEEWKKEQEAELERMQNADIKKLDEIDNELEQQKEQVDKNLSYVRDQADASGIGREELMSELKNLGTDVMSCSMKDLIFNVDTAIQSIKLRREAYEEMKRMSEEQQKEKLKEEIKYGL